MASTSSIDGVAGGAGHLKASRLDMLSGPLDVFAQPVTHDLIERRVQGTRYTQTPLNSKGPYTFILPPEGDSFLDVGRIKLYGEISITNGGANLTDTDHVAVVNMIAGSLMENITIYIDNHPLNANCNTDMPYKAVIPTMLSYGSDAAKTHLRCQGFHMDDANRFEKYLAVDTEDEDGDIIDEANDGFIARMKWTTKSRIVHFCTPLPIDFLRTDRLFVPGRELKLQMTRAKDEFLLLSSSTDKKYNIEVHELYLMYERVFLKPQVFDTFMKQWTLGQAALYPSNQTSILRIPLPANITTFNIPYVYQGTLPQHLMLAFVESEALNGSFKTNPFYFHHYYVNYIDLKINGMSIPNEAYRPCFDSANGKAMKYMREYYAMMENIGIYRSDKGCQVTYELYEGGCFIVPYDLTPDGCNQYHHHAEKTGLVQLQLGFEKPTTKAITLLVIMSHQQVVGLLRKETQPIRFIF